MRPLRDIIKDIQRHVGEDPDGVFGPDSAGAVLNALQGAEFTLPADQRDPFAGVDARSEATIRTLDPKAQPNFIQFYKLANATAATFGCSYVAISGNRTWDEQNEIYAQGRTKPGKKVTNARGGYSWHNFGVATDFAVFRGKVYLDDTEPKLAAKVHAACALHAAECGLDWGGKWTTLQDTPHFQVEGLPVTPLAGHRAIFKEKGSVL
jgi:peptidoglycan LD-endopeptidase CwlK